MELVFLALLVFLMMALLVSGFPVGFSLPGAAILSVLAAALCGWLFENDVGAYFAQGGPVEWLSAGVTNLRSLYWEVERDTLIAIPLFIFMGITLQKSRIAEDLLVTMAQLFGKVPGGLGISVVFVGALLAATTGIVGATVIAMGMISLPAMIRNKYSMPLATGTICASGTLGQIIPPSIVLIILADQLAGAADIASNARKAMYRESTGEFSMPSEFDVASASAGDMFMGAFIPGLILVAIYMVYILVQSLINPKSAPPVPFEGSYDRAFLMKVLLALVPPLTLILVVLGSIIAGVATVNQAGAIGAIGALIMGGYRLVQGGRFAYVPAVIATVSVIEIFIVINLFHVNIKSINSTSDAIGVALVTVGAAGLVVAIVWSLWRTYKTDGILTSIVKETTTTTSMVFIILLGAAMLTSAFRAFGGEELVREYLTSLPGGFWTQFVVVMIVIFLLGFFLDFIEIAVVVVPIVAPILLTDPEANITAVWFGVMVGLNLQTSYLTPPFGFALFYLRSVAPAVVKTLQIYRGALTFVALQLMGLVIAGVFPPLVNYLPNLVYLTSDVAPPPVNPRLQRCLETYVFDAYNERREDLLAHIARAEALDRSVLPASSQKKLAESFAQARATFSLAEAVQEADRQLQAFLPEYRPLHSKVRRIRSEIGRLERDLEKLEWEASGIDTDTDEGREEKAEMDKEIAAVKAQVVDLKKSVPGAWPSVREEFARLDKKVHQARLQYRQNKDSSFETVRDVRQLIHDAGALEDIGKSLGAVVSGVSAENKEQSIVSIKEIERRYGAVSGVYAIKSKLSKARRTLAKDPVDLDKARSLMNEAADIHAQEVAWRTAAAGRLLAGISRYMDAVKDTIGARVQPRLSGDQTRSIASCQSHHVDVSLKF